MIKNLIRITLIGLMAAVLAANFALADEPSISADPEKLEFTFIANDPYNPLLNETKKITLSNPSQHSWDLDLKDHDHWAFLQIWPMGGSQAETEISVTLKPEHFLLYGGGNPVIEITASYFDVQEQEYIYEIIEVPVYISAHQMTILSPDRGIQGETVYISIPLDIKSTAEATLEDYQQLLSIGPYITNNNPGVHVDDVTIDEVNMQAIIKATIDEDANLGSSDFVIHFDEDISSISEDDTILYFWVISKFSPGQAKQEQTLDIQFTHYEKLVLDNETTADWLKNTLVFNTPGITVNSANIVTNESSTLVTYNITIDEDTKIGSLSATSPLVGNDNVSIPFIVLPRDEEPPVEPPENPIINSITPEVVATLEAITISGDKFGVEAGEIWIDGIEATYTNWFDTSVENVIVPANVFPGKAKVTLITSFETDTEAYIWIKSEEGSEEVKTEEPSEEVEEIIISIDQLIPAAGPAGTEVKLLGKDFGESQSNSYVFFGDQTVKMQVLSWASEEIKAIIPSLYVGGYDIKVVKVPDITDVSTIQESNTENFNITFLASAGQATIYPNPFSPTGSNSSEVTIAYNAGTASQIGIYIYDLAGQLVHKKVVTGSQTSWNGYNDQSKLAGDGPYIVRIVDESTKELLAKGKILVIKQ